MTTILSRYRSSLFAYPLLLVASMLASKATAQENGNAFQDHGVASPVSNHRGVVATVDSAGRNVVLIWLFDHRGGYALLMIDADSGKSEEFAVPFAPEKDTPYASLLSSRNKFYTLYNGNFLEFDPVKRAFTFHRTTLPKMAMGMTEDDKGIIWAVTYPNSGVVSFNPATREMKDYGYVYKQNWRQYQRSVAADDRGWIYFAVGNTASQIVAFEPNSGETTPLLAENERKRGMAYVYSGVNGKAYGQALNEPTEDWYELYGGEARKIGKHDTGRPKHIITGSQGLFHTTFPDGKTIQSCDLIERRLIVRDPVTKTEKAVTFEYSSEGAWVMGVAATAAGSVSGGTTFPMRYFGFDPKTGTWVNRPALGQFNALAKHGKFFYFGVYPGGSILEWDTSKEWVDTEKDNASSNPRFLAKASPVLHRPHRLVAHPDGNTLIMSGTPEYGYTGGGLLFWDRKKETETIVKDTEIVPDQSTMSLVVLGDGNLLGGTTTAPGSGGEKKATEAKIYKMNIRTRRVEWQKVILRGVQEFSDLFVGPKGLVFGIADKKTFFVFDPKKRKVIHTEDASAHFGPSTGEQSPRIFVNGPSGEIYLLFKKGILQLDPASFKLTWVGQSPVPIDAGGDYLDGRIFFVSGSHIWSYSLN